MFAKIWALYGKHKKIVNYLIFGGMTTLVNLVVYFVLAKMLGVEEVTSNALAWVAAVAFAYVTNRLYVFESSARSRREIMREMASFVLFRLASGAVDIGLFALCVKVFGWNDVAVKLALQVLVVVLNYIFSKVFVFREQKHERV